MEFLFLGSQHLFKVFLFLKHFFNSVYRVLQCIKQLNYDPKTFQSLAHALTTCNKKKEFPSEGYGLKSHTATHPQIILLIPEEALPESYPCFSLLSIPVEDLGIQVVLKLLQPPLVGL